MSEQKEFKSRFFNLVGRSFEEFVESLQYAVPDPTVATEAIAIVGRDAEKLFQGEWNRFYEGAFDDVLTYAIHKLEMIRDLNRRHQELKRSR